VAAVDQAVFTLIALVQMYIAVQGLQAFPLAVEVVVQEQGLQRISRQEKAALMVYRMAEMAVMVWVGLLLLLEAVQVAMVQAAGKGLYTIITAEVAMVQAAGLTIIITLEVEARAQVE
jgi:hypothetical protein